MSLLRPSSAKAVSERLPSWWIQPAAIVARSPSGGRSRRCIRKNGIFLKEPYKSRTNELVRRIRAEDEELEE